MLLTRVNLPTLVDSDYSLARRPLRVDPSIHGSVVGVTLDDPDHRNVLSTAMVLGIGRAFDQAEADGEVRSVVIAGAGTAFCAGTGLETLLGAANGDFTPSQPCTTASFGHSPLSPSPL